MPDYDCTAKCLVCGAEAFFSYFLSFFLVCAFPGNPKFQKGANASKKRSESSFCSHAFPAHGAPEGFSLSNTFASFNAAQRWFETQ